MQRVHAHRTFHPPGLLVGPHLVGGQQGGVLQGSRQAQVPHLQGGDQVQPEQGQVRQVVPGQGLAQHVGVQQAQAAEPAPTGSGATQIRDEQPLGVPDDHVGDRAAPIHQHADLSADAEGQLGQVAGQLRTDDLVGLDAPAIQVAQRPQVGRFEAIEFSVEWLHRATVTSRPGSGNARGRPPGPAVPLRPPLRLPPGRACPA